MSEQTVYKSGKSPLKPEEKKVYRMCARCGKARYPSADMSRLGAITAVEDKCPICKRETILIPVRDYEYASGMTEKSLD